jgi:hypothetical protein
MQDSVVQLVLTPKENAHYQGVAIVPCVPSKTQIRQWFVTNYSDSCPQGCTKGIEDL